VTTSSVSQPILSSLPGNTAVMASQGRAGMDRGLPRPLTGSPWENGYIESFNARLRDELLNGEIFYTLREAQIVIESWRRHYNTIRPHASIGYKPPAPEVFVPAFTAWGGGLTSDNTGPALRALHIATLTRRAIALTPKAVRLHHFARVA
jgi:hypothetical protein